MSITLKAKIPNKLHAQILEVSSALGKKKSKTVKYLMRLALTADDTFAPARAANNGKKPIRTKLSRKKYTEFDNFMKRYNLEKGSLLRFAVEFGLAAFNKGGNAASK